MAEATPLPSGPLNSVERTWDFKSGWVRAPIQEIVCNNSLSKQARLLWLWLASLKSGDRSYTWGDCEEAMGCQTKARKNCLAQLIAHGFIEIKPNGVVVLKDPYKAFEDDNLSSDAHIVTQKDLVDEIDETPTIVAKQTPAIKTEKKPSPNESITQLISSWNNHKPDSYQKLRTVSSKDWEAFVKQMKNLKHSTSDVDGFISLICKGIAKSDFWSKTVKTSGRNFSAIFGYGNVQDKKMRNVQVLYELGSQDLSEDKPAVSISIYREEIDALQMIKMNLDRAKRRGDLEEMQTWTDHYNNASYSLVSKGVNIDDI